MDTPNGGTAYDICFHPNWKENGYVYVGWNAKLPTSKRKTCSITRYTTETKAPTPST